MLIPLAHIPRSWPNAMALFPFILVRRERKADAALIEHESVHWWRQMPGFSLSLIVMSMLFGLFGITSPWLAVLALPGGLPWVLLYLCWPAFRWEEECQGFAAQVAAGGHSIDSAAEAITTRYYTGRTLAQTTRRIHELLMSKDES